MSVSLHSSIVKGFIAHIRHFPKEHAFQYPVRMQCIELGELESGKLQSSFLGNLLFGYNAWRVYSLLDSDYLREEEGSIREKLSKELKERGLPSTFQQVYLCSSPRFFGYVFNPVSFYFCMGEEGRLAVFLAEVNNTFGDKHIYVQSFSRGGREGSTGVFHAEEFHVSPFNPVEGEYHFTVRFEEKKIFVNIDIERERKIDFSGLIDGERVPWVAETTVLGNRMSSLASMDEHASHII